jgi:hypothetical protein
MEVPESVVRMRVVLIGVRVTATLSAAIRQSAAIASGTAPPVAIESAIPITPPMKKSGKMNPPRAFRRSRELPVAGRVVVPPDVDPDGAHAADSLGTRLEDGRIVYAYDAGGRRRYGNVRAFGEVWSAGGGAAERVAARYPVGRAVTVRHAPDRPDLSVLEPGVAREAWMLPAAGAAFLLFGLATIRWGVPALASQSAAPPRAPERVRRRPARP